MVGVSNPLQYKVFGQEGDTGTDTSGGDTGDTGTDTSGGDTGTGDVSPSISYCRPSSEACSASDVLLNDEGSVLCDPSDGTDCTPYLNPPTFTPSEGDTGVPPIEGDTGVPPSDQGNSGGPLPEFDYLTGGDAGAPVIQATDPSGQYCNPTVESCDPAIVSPGSCFTDITTHASKCDYSNRGSEAPPEGVTNGDLVKMGVNDCDPATQTCVPSCDPATQNCEQYISGGPGEPKPCDPATQSCPNPPACQPAIQSCDIPPPPPPSPCDKGLLNRLGGGLWSGNTRFSVEGGQVMQFGLKNTNPVIGTDITIDSGKTGAGSQSLNLGPFSSGVLKFTSFGHEPRTWHFEISFQSDVHNVAWDLQSSWLPGCPPNR